ncbi:MAG: TIGR00730 family Rossman fold protein [Planctomycetes bacterium]|nr:TIGR00730 family Rossman fold protein [Planctomycetota bacterium]
MKSVCVFCGSKVGVDDVYREQAAVLGRLLAEQGIRLVFGGGSIGLMGVMADAVLESGGRVTGVIPRMLATKELLHTRVSDMHQVDDMHTRKALMAELSDAFVALPGGYGTFEELFEIITWAQLGIHEKNIGLLNVAGFFDPLVRMIDHAIQEGFIKPKQRELIIVEERPDALLKRLVEHQMPQVKKWLKPQDI